MILQQGAETFCKNNKCLISKISGAVGKLPVGIGNTVPVIFEQNKMTKGCKRSVLFFGKFKQDVLAYMYR